MKIITTPELTKAQKETIIFLWNREYPEKVSVTKESFEDYLATTSNHHHFLLLDDANEIIGWAYTFDREDDRWFSILINSLYHGLGLGRKMIDHLKATENRLNGWVLDRGDELRKNGEPYISPLEFYVKNGFTVCTDIRFENEKMSAVKILWER